MFTIEYYANKISGHLKNVHLQDKITIGILRSHAEEAYQFYSFVGEFDKGLPNGFFVLKNEVDCIMEEAIYIKGKLLLKYDYSFSNDTSILYDLEQNGKLEKLSSDNKHIGLRYSFTNVRTLDRLQDL